jgi:hypothetical protein
MTDNYYQEFNEFQSAFYTNKAKFAEYTNYDVKRHGYALFNNMAKGFPNLVNIHINLKGFNWKAIESIEILKALQSVNFINGFSKNRIPDFVFAKQLVVEKDKSKAKKTESGMIFDSEIQSIIMSILFIDSKTYEYLKFSPAIQNLGCQLVGEFFQKEKIKQSTKKKK